MFGRSGSIATEKKIETLEEWIKITKKVLKEQSNDLHASDFQRLQNFLKSAQIQIKFYKKELKRGDQS